MTKLEPLVDDRNIWFVLDGLNAEPWRIGPITIAYGRGGGKFPAVGRDQQLFAFQEAVREVVGSQKMLEGKLSLSFYIWRRRDEYTTAKQREHRKHEADATNMQKATEDALQGILFANDRDVSEVYTQIVDQGPEVHPRIIIRISNYIGLNINDIPNDVWDEIEKQKRVLPASNEWNAEVAKGLF